MHRFIFRTLILSLLFLSACAATERYPLGMSAEQYLALSPADQQSAWDKQAELDRQERERQERAAIMVRRSELEAGARERLGILPEEWNSFSAEKQISLVKEQEAIEREEGARAEELDIRRREADAAVVAAQAAEHANALEAKAQHDALYNNPIYGNVANCTIQGGTAKFSKGFSSDWRSLDVTRFSIAKGDARTISYQRLDKQKFTGSFWVSFSGNGQELEFCAAGDTDRRYKRCRKHTVSKEKLERGYSAALDVPDAIDKAQLSCTLAPGRGQR